jgi:hypothetical protein
MEYDLKSLKRPLFSAANRNSLRNQALAKLSPNMRQLRPFAVVASEPEFDRPPMQPAATQGLPPVQGIVFRRWKPTHLIAGGLAGRLAGRSLG